MKAKCNQKSGKKTVLRKFLDADAEAPVAGHAPVHGIQP